MQQVLKLLSRPVRLAALAVLAWAVTLLGSAPAQAQTGVVRMENGALLAPEFARIINRGELVVALLGVDQPPFFEEKNGKLSGFDVDFAREIAQKLGVRVRFNRQAQTFDGVVTLLAEGQADLAISKLSRTLSRARVVSFSAP